MSYETEQIDTGSLMRCFVGYYSEMFIQNNTRNNIVAIDCNNNKFSIPPISNNQIGREFVIVWKRSTTGQTVDRNNMPVPLPGLRIAIPIHDLNRDGGYFIDEINMVLCTEAMSVTTSHPKSCITFEDAAYQASIALLEKMEQAPTLKLIANDPEGRYNKLYTAFGDMIVEIDITKMYGEAELLIDYYYNGKQNSFSVDLDEFFNKAEEVLELNDLPIAFLTTNKARAMKYTSEYKRIPQSDVDELMKKAATKSAKDIAAVKDRYETEVSLKESENKRLADTIKNLTAEKNQLETNLQELNAAISASNTLKEKEVKSQELTSKSRISENNVDISTNDVKTSEAKRNSAETESKYKLWHIIAAASIPAIGMLCIKVAEHYSKGVVSKSILSNTPKLICTLI